MLTREGGATAAQLEAALGWKQPTIRTAIQRVTRACGLTWRHVKGEDGAKSRWEASPVVYSQYEAFTPFRDRAVNECFLSSHFAFVRADGTRADTSRLRPKSRSSR